MQGVSRVDKISSHLPEEYGDHGFYKNSNFHLTFPPTPRIIPALESPLQRFNIL